MQPESKKYTQNPGVTFTVLHGAGSNPRYMCEIPHAGGGLRRYAIPSELAELLSLFNGQRDLDEILDEHKLVFPDTQYTIPKLRRLVTVYCLPNALLIDPLVHKPAEPAVRAVPSSPYMYAKVRVLSHSTVYPIARRLGWLFSRPALVLFVALSFLMHVWFYWKLLPASHFNIARVSGLELAEVGLLTILAAFCHEFGHATALAIHGSKRLQIGFGLYLYLPVLYTDVSEAWQLRPMSRVLVDAGGIYFHCLSQLALFASFFIWHKDLFLYTIFLIDITITSSLNPFLRMDGYWLLSDLCGMWNLRKQSFQLIRHCWLKITKPGVATGSLDIQPRAMAILSVYTVIFVVFCGYLLVTMGRQLVFHVIPEYPSVCMSLVQEITHPASLHISQLMATLFELLWRTALIVGCFIFIRNGVRRATTALMSARRRQGKTAIGIGDESYRYRA